MPHKPCLIGEVKGHNMNKISFDRILFATACLGSPGVPVPSLRGGREASHPLERDCPVLHYIFCLTLEGSL